MKKILNPKCVSIDNGYCCVDFRLEQMLKAAKGFKDLFEIFPLRILSKSQIEYYKKNYTNIKK